MAPTRSAPCIVWFREDLRISDHPALHAASRSGAPIVCLYILENPEAGETGSRPFGSASRWWLAQSLRSLQGRLSELGSQLILRSGTPARIVPELARRIGAETVFWNDIAQAPALAMADRLEEELRAQEIVSRRFAGDLLAEPAALRTRDGRGFRVFTPFWRRLQSDIRPADPLPAPEKLSAVSAELVSDRLEDWGLEPTRPDWAAPLRETWTPGETAAQARLDAFLEETVNGYAGGRDLPGHDHTSGLSPHLRFGEVSPRQIWHAARFAAAERPAVTTGIDKFLSELGWREFCRHLLHDRPDLADRNIDSSFDAFPWQRDEAALQRWQRGQTGYPLVDAGMRQLWYSGVMHNRVRMVVASFLVKHLLIDWREGERWFWDTLVDADPGSNPANWQWVAGCGADAAPYFRIFNPILQGEKFDPDGAYVRRWVPELTQLSPRFIHRPWEAPAMELHACGIELGTTYPRPIADHAKARERALQAYAGLRAPNGINSPLVR